MAVLAGLGLIDVVGSFVFGGVGVLTVILATTTYGSGEAGTGYLNAAIGVGGLVGALLSGALVLRPRLGSTLVVGAVAMGVGLVLLGVSGDIGPALVALTIAAAGSLVLEVVSTTIFQRAIPDAIRGRALGVIATASSLAFAAGSFLVPVLADRYGTSIVLGLGGRGRRRRGGRGTGARRRRRDPPAGPVRRDAPARGRRCRCSRASPPPGSKPPSRQLTPRVHDRRAR